MNAPRTARGRAVSGLIPVYLGLAMATILAGLGLRLLPLGPPFPLAKWGGSVLWAAMVYWLVAALLPNLRAITAAAVAGVVAGTVEMVRLYHSPGLDAFRLTLAGKLLLGRVFSPWHPVVYWATITLAAALDWTLLRRFVRAQR